MARMFRSYLFPIVLFLFLIGLFFYEVIFCGKVLISKTADCYYSQYSWAWYFKYTLTQCPFPLWNPLCFCGTPYGAQSTSNVCILNLLVWLFRDVNIAWNFKILGNMWCAGVFTFFFMKRKGYSFAAGMIAGIIYAFNLFTGSFTINFAEGVSCLIPLILLGAEGYVCTYKIRYLLLSFFAFCLFLLSSNPQLSLYIGLFVIGYFAWRKRPFLGGLLVLCAVGAVSFYTFRLIELLFLAHRENVWFVSMLLPTHLFTLAFPFLFESPFRPETNFFFQHIFHEITRMFWKTDALYYFSPPYLTIGGLTLGLIALKAAREKARFWIGICVFVLVYMITFPLLYPVYVKIPFLGKLPFVQRIFIIFSFCGAVLAGIGMDYIKEAKMRLKPFVTGYLTVTLLVVICLGGIRLFVWIFHNKIEQFFSAYINTHVIGTSAHTQSGAFYIQRIKDFFQFIDQWTMLISPSFVWPVFFIASILCVMWAWNRGLLKKNIFAGVMGILIVIDVYSYLHAVGYRIADTKELYQSSKVVEHLQKDKGVFRIMPVLSVSDVFSVERGICSPEANLIYHIASVEGYDSLFLKRYREFFLSFAKIDKNDFVGVVGGSQGDYEKKMVDFLNVKYFVTPSTVSLALPLIIEDAGYRVYQNTSFLPRAYMVDRVRILSDKNKILSYLVSPSMQFDKEVVIEEVPLLPFSGQPKGENTVQITTYTPHRIEINIHSSENGFLVLSDCYYPGWKVYVDEKVSKIYRANYAFRAVEIPAGDHRVSFVYMPDSFRWGLWVSVVFLCTMCGIALWDKKRKIVKEKRLHVIQ